MSKQYRITVTEIDGADRVEGHAQISEEMFQATLAGDGNAALFILAQCLRAIERGRPTKRSDRPEEDGNKTVSVRPKLIEALEEILTVCTESRSETRKRMGTRAGNCIVIARKALALAREGEGK